MFFFLELALSVVAHYVDLLQVLFFKVYFELLFHELFAQDSLFFIKVEEHS